MAQMFSAFPNLKLAVVIGLFFGSSYVIYTYQSVYFSPFICITNQSRLNFLPGRQIQYINQSSNDPLTFERRILCNFKQNESCYSTNKSLVVTFWNKKSIDKWAVQNISSSFPLHSFDHMIFVFDNSSWHTHPGFKDFIWIRVQGQHRLWYLKRFLLPLVVKAYQFLWIVDDDAQLNFFPLHYQCVVKNLSISLSSPGRLTGALSHGITRLHTDYKDRIGRWTDFVETGPIVILSSFAWQCIYKYIDASTVTGWGIDLIWCRMIAAECLPESERRRACAILDAFSVDHQSPGVNSAGDGMPELPLYMDRYPAWLTKQETYDSLANNSKLVELCKP